MTRQPVKTFFPQTRLSELAARPGGISRSDAIEGAQKSIESLRGEGDATIQKAIADIETITYGAKGGKLPENEMCQILKLADQVVTLAGTFGYATLDKVARSLCDLTDGLVRAEMRDVAPIAVHAQSMHLLAPGFANWSDADIEKILAELGKVLKHYDFGTLALPGVAEDGEIALSPR